jgi:isopenicillin N synthase-like dioxygenase
VLAEAVAVVSVHFEQCIHEIVYKSPEVVDNVSTKGISVPEILAQTIPVIGVAGLQTGTDAERRRVAREIGDAARSIGFLSITGHGIPADLLAATFEQSRAFFDLPRAEKDRIATNGGYRGYIHPSSLKNGDQQESFDMGVEFGPGEDPYGDRPLTSGNKWPELPGFRETLLAVFNASFAVFEEMHRAIAIDLGADPEFFTPLFGRNYGFRLSHYAAVADPTACFGASPHSDFGNLTLLAQDSPGLEVQGQDGTWIPVEVTDGALVCNIGDMLARWSNGTYLSTRHRVINPTTKSRFSVGFFANADLDAIVAPFPSCVEAGQLPKFPPIEFGEFMQDRVKSGYVPEAISE